MCIYIYLLHIYIYIHILLLYFNAMQVIAFFEVMGLFHEVFPPRFCVSWFASRHVEKAELVGWLFSPVKSC